MVATLLAGTGLVIGASPGDAFTSSCNNGETLTPGVPPTGEDVYVDVNNLVLVGVDLELAEATSGNPGPIVCVNNDRVSASVHTTGGLYVTVLQCPGTAPCPPLLDDTGLKSSGPTTVNLLPATTVDPGYDLYVDGTNLTP